MVDRISREVNDALNQPKVRNKLLAMKGVPASTMPDQFADFVREQYELYRRVLREAGVQPQ